MKNGQSRTARVTAENLVQLSDGLLARSGLDRGTPLVVERTAGGLLLLPALPDAKRIYLEPTTRCNFACQTCIRHSWEERPADMDYDLFASILAQLPAFPHLASVHFAGYGEPLSHPRILDMLHGVRALGIETEITTNGSLLDEPLARALVRVELGTLVVSVDGARPRTYSSVRAGADLGQVLENVRRLLRIKAEMDSPLPYVGFEFVALRRNQHELPDLMRLGKEMGVDFAVVTNVLPHTVGMAAEALYGDGPMELAVPSNAMLGSGYPRLTLPQMQLRTERYCRFVENASFAIARDGKISPCYPLMHAHTAYVLGRRKEMQRWTAGDVRERPLAEIWTAPEYVRFRARVCRFDFPSCADCPFADGCYFSQSNEEDCWGNRPSCADCLWARGIVRCF